MKNENEINKSNNSNNSIIKQLSIVRSSSGNEIKCGDDIFTVPELFKHLLGEDYLVYNYRAEFDERVEKHLDSEQLTRLQYEVLNHNFWTPKYKNPLGAEDRKELELLISCTSADSDGAERWKSRFKWVSYWDNAMMFGATKNYKEKSNTKALYFYKTFREYNKIYYLEIDYSWEKYAYNIMSRYYDAVSLFGEGNRPASAVINSAIAPFLYCQYDARITLPDTYKIEIAKWLDKVINNGAAEREFPFRGKILNGGVNFFIDIKKTFLNPSRTAEEQRENRVTEKTARSSKEKALVKHIKDLETAGFKSGEEVAVKSFHEKGMNKQKIALLKKNGLIESISRGIYKVI